MDGRVWFGVREDTARAWGPDPGPAPQWIVDESVEPPFEDPTSALDVFALDDEASDGALDAEGLIAGAVDTDHHATLSFADSDHHTEVVPYYQSSDYIMFQANQAHMNAMYNTNNAVDWNLNGIAGY